MDAILQFTVTNQELERTDEFIVVEGSENYLQAQFTFTTPDWDGLIKTGVFIDADGDIHPSLCTGDICEVPKEWLIKQKGFVGLIGTDGIVKITTKAVRVSIKEKGYTSAGEIEEETQAYFDQLIAAFAEKYAEAEAQAKLSKRWAVGLEEEPDTLEDNAKYYADESKKDAEETKKERTAVSELAEHIDAVAMQVNDDKTDTDQYKDQASASAAKALQSEQAAKSSETAAMEAQAGAEAAEGQAEIFANQTAEDRSAVEAAKTLIMQMGQGVADNKASVEKAVSGFEVKHQQAVEDINNAGAAQVSAITEEGNSKVANVQEAAAEIIADREQISNNKNSIDSLKSDLDNLENTVGTYVYSKNLFDQSKAKDGRYNWTGVIDSGSESSYWYTEYIQVEKGQHLVFSRSFNGIRQKLTISRVIRYKSDMTVYHDDGNYTINSVNNYVIPDDVKYVIVTCSKVVDLMIEVNEDGEMTDYEPYFEPYLNPKFVEKEEGKSLSTNDFTDEYKNKLDDITSSTPVFHVFLPKIYVAVGRTIEIYNNQVCLESNDFKVKWTCNVGRQLDGKYMITGSPSNIGTFEIKYSLMNNNLEVVKEVTSTVEVVDNIQQNVVINPVGDSLTNGKAWLAEVENISNGHISYNGTIAFSVKDANGNTRTGGHEGRSGKAGNFYVGQYAEGQDVTNNPYWDGTKFDWSFYLQNNSFSFDGVQIFLGMNGLSLSNTSNIPQMKTMVDNIRSYDNTIPIFIVLCQFKGDQNGLGYQQSVDGYHSTSGKWKYEEDCKMFNLITSLYEQFKEYNNLYFIPLAECHDSANNYPTSIVAVNPRSTETVKIQTESVHPNVDGYYQFADIMYSVYCKAFDVNY